MNQPDRSGFATCPDHGEWVEGCRECFDSRWMQVMQEELQAEDQEGYWWLSFCDPNLPKGSQFLGACLVPAMGYMHAISVTHMLGINPGGEVAGWGPVPKDRVPEGHPICKLMSREEIEEMDERV